VVDVLLTRPIPGAGSSGTDKMTDVVIEAVPVLGIDQVSDESQTKPAPGKTATLEVDSFGAQKLALSVQLGALSLALRNVADQNTGPRATVVPRHLTQGNYFIRSQPVSGPPPVQLAGAVSRSFLRAVGPMMPPKPRGPAMIVVRGAQSTEYEVLHGW
jgi:pilus assembly protein CpaB